MYRLWLWLRKPENTLWVTPALGAILSVSIALFASVMPKFIFPEGFSLPDIDLKSIDDLLDVLSTSMLAVTTFSLSIMVSAFASAANGATPRATQLVMADDNTRIAIASFISAFIYAVIAKTALGMGYYDQNGRFMLFVATALVMLYLIITLIRWVYTLSQLGRLENTIAKIEHQAMKNMAAYRAEPFIGAAGSEPDDEPIMLLTNHEFGYLTHIDIETVNERAVQGNYRLHITVRPGKLLYPGDILAKVYCHQPNEEDTVALRDAFVVQAHRSYDQDPRYGLIVLSEVGQRALSPAVNDPGTAITVMTSLAKILISDSSKEEHPTLAGAPYYCISMVALPEKDLLVQPFEPIIRDGAANLDIAARCQKLLAAIWRLAPDESLQEAAYWQAKRALIFHHSSDMLAENKAYIDKLHHQLFVEKEHEDTEAIWQFLQLD